MTLFTYRWKLVGWCCYILLIILLVYYFSVGISLKIPVLVFFSSYEGVGWLSIQKTNIADEVLLLLYLAAIIFIFFSKEKDENPFSLIIKSKSLAISIFTLLMMSAFNVLFIYGGIFLHVAGAIILFFPIIYIVIKAIFTNKNRITS